MPKFDAGKFGSALATNIGNFGQQYFGNQLLQQQQDKRAYTRADEEMALKLATELGIPLPESLRAKYPMSQQLMGGQSIPEIRATREREQLLETERALKNEGLGSYKPTQSDFEKKLDLVQTPEGRAQLEQLYAISNSLSPKDKLYLKQLGLDIQLKERELAGKTLPASVVSDMTQTENTKELLGEWKGLYDISKRDNLGWVGPVSGRRGSVEETFAGGQLDPGQADFYALEARVKNMVIKEITGAQLGEKEAQRIMKEIPSRNMPSEVWEARFRQTQKNIDRIRKIREKKFGSAGYRIPDTPQETNNDPLGIR